MNRLTILNHHIYELRKGLRNLILFTTPRQTAAAVISKLEASEIPYLIRPVSRGSDRINVFFGSALCIEVLRALDQRRLAEFSAEEDFILGIMLGYDRMQQCERFLQHKRRRRVKKKRDER